MEELVPAPVTRDWYRLPAQCIRWDQERVGQRHTFVGQIPRGVPLDPAPLAHMTSPENSGPIEIPAGLPYGASQMRASTYLATSAPLVAVDPRPAMDAARNTPQFAWRMSNGPATPVQMEVESHLRRLDQPFGRCNEIAIPMDAPLFRNTVAPPRPVNVPAGVQNACNPIAALRGPHGEGCREEADRVAATLSSRWLNNPTRQDTQRIESPVTPPGIGTIGDRPGGVSIGGQLIAGAGSIS